MDKFMPKISPTMRNIRKNFKKVGIVLGIIFLLLWFVRSEAKRVHAEMWGAIHTLQYLHKGDHNGN